jgi:hypothetical protein
VPWALNIAYIIHIIAVCSSKSYSTELTMRAHTMPRLPFKPGLCTCICDIWCKAGYSHVGQPEAIIHFWYVYTLLAHTCFLNNINVSFVWVLLHQMSRGMLVSQYAVWLEKWMPVMLTHSSAILMFCACLAIWKNCVIPTHLKQQNRM